MVVFAAAALGLAAAAPDFAIFALALGIVGVTAVVAQIVVPMSSSLAAERERGSVVGTVMSGLLIGILVARTISGIFAELLDWRAVFVIAAGGMLLLAAVLRCALPRVPPTEQLPYRELLRSVPQLVRGEPLLRQRMVLGAVAFGSFSVLWTSVAFLLAGPPYHYGNAVIGLFGLAGLAGALAAPVAGRLSDRGHMVAYFMGGVALSAATSALYSAGGWTAICALGVGTAAFGLIAWVASEYAMTGRLLSGADSAA